MIIALIVALLMMFTAAVIFFVFAIKTWRE